jgi:hypothetical protein
MAGSKAGGWLESGVAASTLSLTMYGVTPYNYFSSRKGVRMQKTTIWLTDPEKEAVAREAKRIGSTQSEVIRGLIDEELLNRDWRHMTKAQQNAAWDKYEKEEFEKEEAKRLKRRDKARK